MIRDDLREYALLALIVCVGSGLALGVRDGLRWYLTPAPVVVPHVDRAHAMIVLGLAEIGQCGAMAQLSELVNDADALPLTDAEFPTLARAADRRAAQWCAGRNIAKP